MTGDGDQLWGWQHARANVEALDLEPVPFSAIPGWEEDDHSAAFEAYVKSAQITGQPLPSAQLLNGLCGVASRARAFFEDTFTPYRVVAAPGLLTAYFEPILKGSRQQSREFPVPVYRRPRDLRQLSPGDPLTASGLTAARAATQGLVPYFTRGEIEAGALKGQGLELVFLSDPIEAFVMHVQGSGLIELDDATSIRLTFDGKNGHPYTSISKLLVERGALTLDGAHLDGMLAWLQAQPGPQAYLNENKSYIFFRELNPQDEGPKGSCGAALTSGRSLAADPLYHAPGTPIWVEAPQLTFENRPLSRLLIAQDTGSAIVGPQRGDIFAGLGREAGHLAGRVRHTCSFIVLRPKG